MIDNVVPPPAPPPGEPGEWAWLLDGLEVTRLRFRLSPTSAFTPPPYPGPMLRGALGTTLRLLEEPRQHEATDGYREVYRPTRDRGRAHDTVSDNLPPPYVVEWAMPAASLAADSNWEFDLLLLGRAAGRYADRMVDAVNLAARAGLGGGNVNGGGNVKHRLRDQAIVSPGGKAATVRAHLTSTAESAPGRPLPAGAVTLDLETPLRLGKKRSPIETLDFVQLYEGIHRRCRMVCRFHGHLPVPEREEALHEVARGIYLDAKGARWTDGLTRRAAAGNTVPLDGVVGHIALRGNLGPFETLLRAAELLHVGRWTTLGHGRLSIQRSPEPEPPKDPRLA